MTNEEIKELEKRTYDIGWSGFPIDILFNDIRDNDRPRFNKDLAYQDFKKIIDEIYKLKYKAEKYDGKEMAMKPYFLNYGGYKIGNWKCPICNEIITKDNYCKHCGQKLDWSGEDDR